ncbi:NUDIX domain-containing protein [Bacillus haimaensis]|uniref:NUDIX domain-containing protein n=1 Tax=Bacillus haimaensis TaxID=3160967 RepID=UPI003AA8D3DB
MINITSNIVKTSGAYILYSGLFPFQVGPTKEGDKLGVVRLGGHRENNETALEAAKREVFEEASMIITPVSSPVTYYKTEWDEKPVIIKVDDEISPVLIKGNREKSLSVMYLSYANNKPKPSSETNGLLLLTPDDVQLICNNKITLNEYLQQNGIAILKRKLNQNLILEPFPQLLFLSELLKEEPALMKEFLKK